MAFTPSNLAIAQLGSLKLTIATQNASTASGTDLWTSGIPDIQAVVPVWNSALNPLISATSFAVSFTQSTGTIHIIRGAGFSASAFTLLVFSGFASDMTW